MTQRCKKNREREYKSAHNRKRTKIKDYGHDDNDDENPHTKQYNKQMLRFLFE